MVYLCAITPALCELLDSADSNTEATTAMARSFIEERLRCLVHTQAPSQLDNALWIYLLCQQQLLSRTDKTASGTTSEAASSSLPKTAAQGSLPGSLHHPSTITTITAAVQWYGGELQVPANVKSDENTPATAAASGNGERQGLRGKKSDAAARTVAHGGKAAANETRLEELLRCRQALPASQQQSAAPTDTGSGAKSPSTAVAAKEAGPEATIRLALEALSHPKRAAALRQPRSLALIVRDLRSLWSLVYLCRRLRVRQLRKEQVLRGTPSADNWTRGNAGEPLLSVCYHDYDLLLPLHLVRQLVLPLSAETSDSVNSGFSHGSIAALNARCRALSSSAEGNTYSPPMAIIISPAVTDMEGNPDRLRKNARVDAIDEAANRYYYTLLATQAHGQVSGNGMTTSGPVPSSSSSAAAAAAHQEAVRSSLAAADMGDFGVLDPTRMQAPVFGSSMDAKGTSERAARSYALFLRDASIGFDIQLMALSGAGIGYYVAHLHGMSVEWCTCYAVVGLVVMMLVDAVLIMIRMGRQDEAVVRARKRIARQRAKLEKEGAALVRSMEEAAAVSVGMRDGDAVKASAVMEGEGEVAAPSVEMDALTKKNQ